MFLRRIFAFLTVSLLIGVVMLPARVLAAAVVMPAPSSGLSLEVSPSPIVLTIKPGEKKTVDIKVYNAGLSTENLKIGLQSFKINKANSQISLGDNKPLEVINWVTFNKPDFTVKPGERVSVQATIQVPASAGFSYYFAMIISRQATPKIAGGQAAVQGSVAIFTLLNIDRPDATKKLLIDSIQTDHKFYEYLPVTLSLKLKNGGNSLLLPAGNVYIQRHADSIKPISVLPINPNGLYLLPGVTRQFNIPWQDGLPVYVNTQTAVNTAPSRHLQWNWHNSQFRIGRYTAKVVVIYDDGKRDIPVQTEVSFWVIPWRLILGAILGLIVLFIGMISIVRFLVTLFKRNRFKYRA